MTEYNQIYSFNDSVKGMYKVKFIISVSTSSTSGKGVGFSNSSISYYESEEIVEDTLENNIKNSTITNNLSFSYTKESKTISLSEKTFSLTKEYKDDLISCSLSKYNNGCYQFKTNNQSILLDVSSYQLNNNIKVEMVGYNNKGSNVDNVFGISGLDSEQKEIDGIKSTITSSFSQSYASDYDALSEENIDNCLQTTSITANENLKYVKVNFDTKNSNYVLYKLSFTIEGEFSQTNIVYSDFNNVQIQYRSSFPSSKYSSNENIIDGIYVTTDSAYNFGGTDLCVDNLEDKSNDGKTISKTFINSNKFDDYTVGINLGDLTKEKVNTEFRVRNYVLNEDNKYYFSSDESNYSLITLLDEYLKNELDDDQINVINAFKSYIETL